MSPAPEWDHRGQPPEGDAHVRQQLASIDGSLFNGMPADDRYESGVPEGQRGNSLAFIQMTGLTRPPLRSASHGTDGSLAQIPIYDDLNATGPVSFYEKGVADVDDTLGRDSLLGRLSDATLDIDLVPGISAEPLAPEGGASRSAQAFRDIVAGLQRGELAVESPSDDSTPASLDISEAAAPVVDVEAAPYGGSTSGALLALVEELESMMGAPAASPEASPVEDETVAEAGDGDVAAEAVVPEVDEDITHTPVETLDVETPESDLTPVLESPGRSPLSAPAAEIDDESFEALLSSLSGTPREVEEISPPSEAEESVPAVEDAAPEPEDEVVIPESGVADEWDALLDTMSVRGLEPSPPVSAPTPVYEPEPESVIETPATPPFSIKHPGSGALAEAEQLMQALEKKTRTVPAVAASVPTVSTPLPVAPPAPAPESPVLLVPPAAFSAPADQGWVVPVASPPDPYSARVPERSPVSVGVPLPPGEQEGEPQTSYDYSAAPSRRRSRRHSRVARRSRKIVKAVFFVLLLGGLAATLWVFVVGPMLVKDEDLSARAERLMKSQDYGGASQTYLQLASRIAPGDPERSNAEFRAAYALTLGPEHSNDETRSRYGNAVALFKKFTEDYPQHPKRARALSIMGRLYFELRDFDKAIVVLRDQVKPADDPAAALSMLRYLARAYSMTGNYEQAETSYLQAATLPGNYNAEADYLELGKLFRTRAEVAKDTADQGPLKAKALRYWQLALKVPGLAPGDRSVLEEQLNWAAFTEQSGASTPGAAPPADASVPVATAPAKATADGEAAPTPASTSPEGQPASASVVSPIPVPTDEAGRAEAPGAELKALVPAAAPAAP